MAELRSLDPAGLSSEERDNGINDQDFDSCSPQLRSSIESCSARLDAPRTGSGGLFYALNDACGRISFESCGDGFKRAVYRPVSADNGGRTSNQRPRFGSAGTRGVLAGVNAPSNAAGEPSAVDGSSSAGRPPIVSIVPAVRLSPRSV